MVGTFFLNPFCHGRHRSGRALKAVADLPVRTAALRGSLGSTAFCHLEWDGLGICSGHGIWKYINGIYDYDFMEYLWNIYGISDIYIYIYI